MENAGAMIEGGDWSSFSGVYVHEEADFMAQLFPNCSATNEPDGGSSLALGPPCWASHESDYNMAGTDNGSIYTSNTSNSNMYSFPHSSSYSGGSNVVYPTEGHESYYMSDTHQFLEANNSSVSIDFLMSDPKSHVPVQDLADDRVDAGDDCLNLEMSSGTFEESGPCLTETEISGKHLMLKRDSEVSELDPATEEKNASNSRKRPRASDFLQMKVQRGKKNAKSKKNQKLTLDISNEEDNNAAGLNRQLSGTCSSGDESNASQDQTGGATSSLSSKGAGSVNINGKTRASRGSATDPQSLYARKRRERINERLRILQNLVPNGTKVDISTMLEEAVHYVKFLQLQIKLLSSDDMWMYAPLAYNGMDLGLDLNINVPR